MSKRYPFIEAHHCSCETRLDGRLRQSAGSAIRKHLDYNYGSGGQGYTHPTPRRPNCQELSNAKWQKAKSRGLCWQCPTLLA